MPPPSAIQLNSPPETSPTVDPSNISSPSHGNNFGLHTSAPDHPAASTNTTELSPEDELGIDLDEEDFSSESSEVLNSMLTNAVDVLETIQQLPIVQETEYTPCIPHVSLEARPNPQLTLFFQTTMPINDQEIRNALKPVLHDPSFLYESLQLTFHTARCWKITLATNCSADIENQYHSVAEYLMSVEHAKIVGWPNPSSPSSWFVMTLYKSVLRVATVAAPEEGEMMDIWFNCKQLAARASFALLDRDVSPSLPFIHDLHRDNWATLPSTAFQWSHTVTPWIVFFSLKKKSDDRFKRHLEQNMALQDWNSQLTTYQLTNRYYICFPSNSHHGLSADFYLNDCSSVVSYMKVDANGTYACKLRNSLGETVTDTCYRLSFSIQRNLDILYAFMEGRTLNNAFELIRPQIEVTPPPPPPQSDWQSCSPFIKIVFPYEVTSKWMGALLKKCFEQVPNYHQYRYHCSQTRTDKNLYSFSVRCSQRILELFMRRIQRAVNTDGEAKKVRVTKVKGYHKNNGRNLRRPFKTFQHTLTIGTLNIRSSRDKINFTAGLMDSYSMDFLALQETHCDGSTPPLAYDGLFFTENKPPKARASLVGVAAISREETRLNLTFEGTPNLALQLVYESNNRPIIFGSIYIPSVGTDIRARCIKQVTDRLIDLYRDYPSVPIIIAGDFNTHPNRLRATFKDILKYYSIHYLPFKSW